METTKFFNQVIDKFPAVSSFRIWTDVEGSKLVGWQNKHIYVCNITNVQMNNIMMSSKLPSCYEELMCPEDVVEVFCFENKYYIVDRQCYISEMVREIHQDPEWEADLFEDSPKKIVKSDLKRKYRVSKECMLLAACLLPDGIAFLLNTPNSVMVKIVNPDTLNEMKSFTIRSSSVTIKPKHNVSLLLFVPKEEIEAAYIRNWFPLVQSESLESDLLIISLPESIICGVLLEEVPITPHFLFSWPFQAIQAQWFCLENTEPDRIKRKSNLILVFDGGTVVNLEQYGGKTAYMPLNTIRNAYISSDYVLVTDNFDCYCMKTFENKEITCLPVKGVLGFLPVPEQKHIILASTKHRTLYALNLNEKVPRNEFKLPDIGVFDEFLRKHKYLEQLCKKIEEKDNYITALSFAMNSSIMKFHFFVQVVLIAGYLHTFRIKVLSENPGITFRSIIWKVVLSLYSNDCCFTYVRNLESDLTIENPFVDFITVECSGDYWDFSIDANLVSYIGNDKYRPSVNIGTVLLDISHFIQPVSSVKIYESHIEKEVNIREILANISLRYSNQIENGNNNKYDDTRFLCSFEVPINEEMSSDCTVKKLLSNCRALWRTSEMEEICKKDKFEIFIAGNIINIEIKKGFIIISGKNAERCHSMKIASVKLLNDNYKINDVGNSLLCKVDDLIKSVELLEYNSVDSAATKYNKALALYKEIKDNIIFPLTGIKMNFISEKTNLLKDN